MAADLAAETAAERGFDDTTVDFVVGEGDDGSLDDRGVTSGVVDRWRAFLAWRAARVARAALARDLASYRSSAELHELGAIIERCEDSSVAEIERIVSTRRTAGVRYG